MATTVGSLVFQLEANAAKFNSEMGKAGAQLTLLDKQFAHSHKPAPQAGEEGKEEAK